ncbi:helix-turn-helix domain-containing protein [Youngiibacter multivorans]|uniref:AraC-like DNA-binding protein n=1 Tax=Youngiibacter multivorans TaxID=937251 RepID=A0ABS4G5A7_9CLOT|nr:AraC family transcriptional regulator [Youngiibacter multivorans]MBP1919721.1 AraC-like DNA-binding protein [Youngiibacter multivorans]
MTYKVEAVQRMQNYIEDHLTERVTLADLSEAAHFSPWYSARLFKELTGLTPAEYIRRLKLSRSTLRLRDEACRIIDVAYDLGFGSVDSYQRAFFREFGCNPKEYALDPIPLSLFTPYGVKFRGLWKEKNNMVTIKNIFIQVIDRPSRKVIIKRGQKATEYWTYCQEVGCDVWGILTSMKSLFGEPVCLWLPEQYRKPGTSEYVQGVEVSDDFNDYVPDGFDVIVLPNAKYMMFQGEPFEEENYCEAIEALQTAMNRYDPAVIGHAWDDTNPRIQLEPIGTRGYIELRAIK